MHRLLLVGVLLYGMVWGALLPSRLLVSPEETFSHDPGAYNGAAIHLAQDGFYSMDGVQPFLEREPGYSVFLAVIYLLFGMENRFAIFLVQGILTLLAAIFLHRELRIVAGERVAGMAFLLLLALPSVWHTIFSAYRENFALSLTLLFAAAFLRWERTSSLQSAVVTGILLGALILTYIPFLFFPLFLVPLLWWVVPRQRGMNSALGGDDAAYRRLPRLRSAQVPRAANHRSAIAHLFVFVVLPYALVSLWGIRNAVHTGTFQLGAPERTAIMWHVRGEQAEHLRGLEPFRCLWSEYISRDWTGRAPQCSFNAVMHALEENPRFHNDAAGIAAEGREKILRYFPHYLWFSLFEVLELHLPFVNGWGFNYNVLAALSMVILYAGALLALPSIFRRQYAVFLLLALYSTLIYSLTDATPRYLLPVIFCYAVFAAVGYDRVFRRLRRAGPEDEYLRSAESTLASEWLSEQDSKKTLSPCGGRGCPC